MKVFLVEDSLVVRDRLRGMLASIADVELAGEADNEADAVREIYAVRPDVVILDFSLASGNALGVLNQIRNRPIAICAIVLTNYAYPQYREKCMALGADYFLDKTSGIKTLEELLTGLADGSHLHREPKNLTGWSK
jgi:DNA-binding NarL/FixJ family response regulator